ncbi:MAG: hypothetical protein HYY62_00380, partial [Deltaproteobacteria bacterium]|nr:hypothetical protein [Deltaproteobacteria bacterium]
MAQHWPQHWIVTCDPLVTFRFQAELQASYHPTRGQDARSAILPFEQLVYRSLSPSVQRVLTPYDQRFYLKKMREALFPDWQVPAEFEDVTKELFRSLKDKRIAAQDFTKACHETKGFSEHFLKLAKLYERYSQKKGILDQEDCLELAIQNLQSPSFKPEGLPSKVLILAYQLSNLQKIFLEALSKRVEIEQLSHAELEKPTQIPSVFETQTLEQEVELMGAHLEKALQAGHPASSLFVFCTRLADYRQELESVLGRAQVPFSFWNSSQENHECVSLLEWHPNTMVFPHMKRVFLCGASFLTLPLALPPSLLSDEEKAYLNQIFQTTVFKTQSDHKEEAKKFLHLLQTRCQKLCITYRQRPAAAFEEFLKEGSLAQSPQISVTEFHSKKLAAVEAPKPKGLRPKGLRPEGLRP